MKKGIIFLAEPNQVATEAIDILRNNGFEPSYSFGDNTKSKGIFIRTYTKVTKEYLDKFPNLQFILRAGVGVDNIDIEECKKRNIQIFNAPGSNANAVAEYILTVLLMLLKNIPQQVKEIKNRKWRNKNFMGEELFGKTVGLVGCGAIGKTLAMKLAPLGVSLIGFDPYVNAEELKKYSIKKCNLGFLLENTDIICLQLTLTNETKDMFDLNKFSKMKPGCLFINVSRGELVVEKDLIKALKGKLIAGAALDVFRNEPNVNKGFLTIPNLIVTPHVASFTKQADVAMAVGTVNNFLKNYKGDL